MADSKPLLKIDLSKPRYDQSSYRGRAFHFFAITDPRNIFVSSKRLEAAAKLVKQYKEGTAPPGTTEEELWEAKRLADSAFHPDTGEKMFILGRMSAQVPCNMVITGLMLTFYKHPAAVIFWQWMNQSFNALVNYTNRSGDEEITTEQLVVPYVGATTAATVTALSLNSLAKNLPALIGRLVPFSAVAAANCINIPLMRQRELRNGIPVVNEHDERVGISKRAAKKAIAQVCVSRIAMAMPGMVLTAVAMTSLDKRGFFKNKRWATAPVQIVIVGLVLSLATPLCCAIFEQRSSMAVSKLEPEVRTSLQATYPDLKKVYFNKGL